MRMKHIYKFSIVTAVYNTAEYLEEMIESVLNQDIGFKENVQLILVDDGSSDDSLSICREYESKYPNNINVLSLDHSGVSCARNEGMKLAKGKYLNFLDSDDKLSKNALRNVYKFFEKNQDEIDLVAIPLYFFDKEEGQHILNYKFERTRIIDIIKEYNSIQLSASSAFIKEDVIKLYKFNPKLKYAEDAQLITDVILRKGKYGVVKDTKYYYRRRGDNSSATQNNQKREWYIDYIKDFSYNMIREMENVNKKYRSYMQYLVLYDLQWRINRFEHMRKVLNIQEYSEFCDKLIKIIKVINIKTILEQRYIKWYRKIIILGLRISVYNEINKFLLNILKKL